MTGKTAPDVNVLIIGNHPLFMEYLESCLGRDSRTRVVGFAHRAADVIDLASGHPTIDLVLVDMDTATICGSAFVDCIRALQPQCRIVFLSAFQSDSVIESALEARANGLVLKNDLPQSLPEAVREVLDGGSWFPEAFRNRMVIDSLGVRLVPPSDEADDYDGDVEDSSVRVRRS